MKGISIKLNAFTLLEVVVTILLSLILFSLLFLSYNILRQQVSESERDITNIIQFKSYLDAQIEKSILITANEDVKITFSCFQEETAMIFDNEFIICENQNQTDTIYNGTYQYTIFVDKETNLVNKINLKFVPDNDTITACFVKEYLPAIKLRNNIINFEY